MQRLAHSRSSIKNSCCFQDCCLGHYYSWVECVLLEPHKNLMSGSYAPWSVSLGNSCQFSEPDFLHLEKEDSNATSQS